MQKTIKTIRVSRDAKKISYRPLGRLKRVTIEVESFQRYRGETVLVESIDRETLEVKCTNEDGREYFVNVFRFD